MLVLVGASGTGKSAIRNYLISKHQMEKVVSCTTMNVSGKEKRLRGRPGFTSSYKKAIVRLAKGETIKVFEGV